MRRQFSNMEIWCECLGRSREELIPKESNALAVLMARFPDWKRSDILKSISPYGQQRIYLRDE